MEYCKLGIAPSAKSVWLANPEKLIRTMRDTKPKPVRCMKSNAFNHDTRRLISPVLDTSPVRISSKKSTKGEISKSYQKFRNTRYSDFSAGRRSPLLSNKLSIPNKVRLSKKFSQSIDLRTTQSTDMGKTHTSGFGSTQRSTAYGTGSSFSLGGSFYSSKGYNQNFTKVGGYKRVNKNIPFYDFVGKNSTWMNKQGVFDKIARRENERLLGKPKPSAQGNGRKYSPMTAYFKNLEDNRVFKKGKMNAYRRDCK